MVFKSKSSAEQISLSVIIPAYRAENFIEKNLKEVTNVLDTTKLAYEIICVVDGKVDRTRTVAEKTAARFPKKVKVLGYQKNRGKGYAVRYGMARARGDIIGFIDAGLEIDPESLINLHKVFNKQKADIVVGSKWHPKSEITYPLLRRVFSLGYLWLVKILFKVGVSDTQAGIKLFRRELVKKLLPQLTIDGFAFDIEMLMRSRDLGFSRIYEAPIKVKKKKGHLESSIDASGFITNAVKMFWDTLVVFYRFKILYYHDEKSRQIV